MALASLHDLFESLRARPLSFLTSRRLRSLSHFLSGRDLALQHLGAGGWSDLPIAERVEKQFGELTNAWRSWTDIVELFSDDETDAFEGFLGLACSWDDPAPAPPASLNVPPPLTTLMNQIVERPAMFLGEKSVLNLADFLRGYTETISAAGLDSDSTPLTRFLADLPQRVGDATGRPWFKILRFLSANDEEAFDKFVELWRA